MCRKKCEHLEHLTARAEIDMHWRWNKSQYVARTNCRHTGWVNTQNTYMEFTSMCVMEWKFAHTQRRTHWLWTNFYIALHCWNAKSISIGEQPLFMGFMPFSHFSSICHNDHGIQINSDTFIEVMLLFVCYWSMTEFVSNFYKSNVDVSGSELLCNFEGKKWTSSSWVWWKSLANYGKKQLLLTDVQDGTTYVHWERERLHALLLSISFENFHFA